jgi:beta-lactamase regulating signal transducer with metallopeptidase domain
MNPTYALGWTLLHFLWQGALIAGLLAGALVLLRTSGPRVRYAASCAAMLLMLVCAIATFLDLRYAVALPDYSAPRLVGAGFLTVAGRIDGVAPSAAGTRIADYLPALVWAWLAGVVALSIRSVGGWAAAERFARRRTSPAEAVWEARLATLAKRLRISSPVRLVVSALAEVPAVVGWLRPVVLVPTSVFTGLSAEQIDALLAHELAHVRRHDYLINLFQTAVETLFFYHPAVWWVNRKVREERENCCDDLAVEVCGSTVAYVRALTDLEQLRRSTPRLAMAADGGSLLNRVQRLLHAKQSTGSMPSGWTVGIGIAVAVLVTGIAANGLAQRSEPGAPADPEPAAVRPAAVQNVDGAQDAEKVRRQAEMALKNVDAELQNIDVERQDAGIAQQSADIERQNAEVEQQQRQIEQALAVLQRQMALVRQQSGGTAPQDAEVRLERRRAALQQLEVLAQRQNAEVEQRYAAQQQQQTGWLAEIQAAGYHNLAVDQLIRLKEHGVTGEYIRQIRAAGQELSANDVVRFREHGVTADFINEVKGTGFKEVKADDLIRLREHGADAAWIRQIQSAGYHDVSLNDIVRLREHGVTPESIRDGRNRFKGLTLDQLIRMKESGVF